MQKSDEELIFERYAQFNEILNYQSNIASRLLAPFSQKASARAGMAKQANQLTAKLKRDSQLNNFQDENEAVQDTEWFKQWLSKNIGRDYTSANLDMSGNVSQIIQRAIGYGNRYNLPSSRGKEYPQLQPAPAAPAPAPAAATAAPSSLGAAAPTDGRQNEPPGAIEPTTDKEALDRGDTAYAVLYHNVKDWGEFGDDLAKLIDASRDSSGEINQYKLQNGLKTLKFEDTEFIDCNTF